MLPRAALLPVSLLFVVALTGIEPATLQFSSVQLGLSGCVFGPVQFATKAFVAVRMADVLPWCCPAAGIRLIAGQSNTRRPGLRGEENEAQAGLGNVKAPVLGRSTRS